MAIRKRTPTVQELGNERLCQHCERPFTPVSGTQGLFCQRSCWYAWRSAQPSREHKCSIRQLQPGESIPIGEPKRFSNRDGYVRLRWRVGPREYVECYEHRLQVGLPIARHVHHKNEIKNDNSLTNLEVLLPSDHVRKHNPRRFDLAETVRLYQAGLSMRQIAQRLGIDSGRVSRGLRAVGVKARHKSDYRLITGNVLEHVTGNQYRRIVTDSRRRA